MARVRIRLHKPSAPRRPQMTSPTAPSAHGLEQRRAGAGSEIRDLGGQAHAAYVSTVRALKAALQWRELEHLLLHLIQATEADARQSGCAVASVYYGELARLYRRENDRTKELEVLIRFSRLTHQAGASAAGPPFQERGAAGAGPSQSCSGPSNTAVERVQQGEPVPDDRMMPRRQDRLQAAGDRLRRQVAPDDILRFRWELAALVCFHAQESSPTALSRP